MEVRTATSKDLDRIMELGEEFGHRMLYQKDRKLMEGYLSRILVVVGSRKSLFWMQYPEIVGYYHYIVSGDSGFEEMLRCYRQLPEELITEALHPERELCVVMQGGCHRDAFKEVIAYLKGRYSEIWCWNSVTGRPSSKIAGYKELGFVYGEKYTFFNCSKGDYSVYQIGRWKST